MVSRLCCSIFIGLGLKSDGHGNGGTLTNGNGGTHYDLSKFRQQSYIIPVVCINLYKFKYILEAVEHFFTGFKGFIWD